jgi:hypothetical protein
VSNQRCLAGLPGTEEEERLAAREASKIERPGDEGGGGSSHD